MLICSPYFANADETFRGNINGGGGVAIRSAVVCGDEEAQREGESWHHRTTTHLTDPDRSS